MNKRDIFYYAKFYGIPVYFLLVENKPKNKAEDIKNICKIYKEMTFDGHKSKEGLEKAQCMLFAHKYYYEEIKKL